MKALNRRHDTIQPLSFKNPGRRGGNTGGNFFRVEGGDDIGCCPNSRCLREGRVRAYFLANPIWRGYK